MKFTLTQPKKIHIQINSYIQDGGRRASNILR